jgi:hypothetical protein
MATFHVRGYLVNKSVFPDYEITADDLIDKFLGDDTGAPLDAASFELHTDDGYTVYITVPMEKIPGHGRAVRAVELRAEVAKSNS